MNILHNPSLCSRIAEWIQIAVSLSAPGSIVLSDAVRKITHKRSVKRLIALLEVTSIEILGA